MSQAVPSSDPSSAGALAFRRYPRWAGVAVTLTGLAVIVAWYAHWTTVLQVWPAFAPMQFNTALGFVFCGAALVLLTTRLASIGSLLGGLVTLLGLLTILQDVSGRSFGIDQLLFESYLSTATSFPGRMSPLTACCFCFIGIALMFSGREKQSKLRITLAGLLICMAAAIAGLALFGYVFGIETAYGWGKYTRMAVHTACALSLLSSGLLVRTVDTARRENYDPLGWLPATIAVTLIAMIALISLVSFRQLEDSDYWRRHSYQVLAAGQQLLGSLADLQRGVRGYVLTGQPADLQPYENATNELPVQLDRLVSLTADNPAQQGRLRQLSADLDEVMAYSQRLLEAKATGGLKAAVDLESTGEGLAMMNRARADLLGFTGEEEQLLSERSTVVDADYLNTTRLLVVGRAMVVVLLVFANWIASRELRRRRRAEEENLKLINELQESLAEVKTLSGLIPICGWCKNVRSDAGYWQSVEQYVRTHTQATFTHGMCPDCAQKMEADILKANIRGETLTPPPETPAGPK